VRCRVVVLQACARTWADRADVADPIARAAANDAIDGIDALVRELQELRATLSGETREYDYAAAVRVDALLESRAQR
jgi:hypothetical protein